LYNFEKIFHLNNPVTMEISKRLLLAFTFLSLLASFDLFAQDNTVASGGKATGSGGTVNYSVG